MLYRAAPQAAFIALDAVARRRGWARTTQYRVSYPVAAAEVRVYGDPLAPGLDNITVLARPAAGGEAPAVQAEFRKALLH